MAQYIPFFLNKNLDSDEWTHPYPQMEFRRASILVGAETDEEVCQYFSDLMNFLDVLNKAVSRDTKRVLSDGQKNQLRIRLNKIIEKLEERA